MSGGDNGLGGDRDGAGRERAGIDLERGGDLQLTDPLDQADTDRRAPQEDHSQQVRQIAAAQRWARISVGPCKRPARVGELGRPAGPRRPGQLLDQPEGAEYPEVTPAVVVTVPSWT